MVPSVVPSPSTSEPFEMTPVMVARLLPSSALPLLTIVPVPPARLMALTKITSLSAVSEPKIRLSSTGTKLPLPQVRVAVLFSLTVRSPPIAAKPPVSVHCTLLEPVPRWRSKVPFDCSTPPARLMLLSAWMP